MTISRVSTTGTSVRAVRIRAVTATILTAIIVSSCSAADAKAPITSVQQPVVDTTSAKAPILAVIPTSVREENALRGDPTWYPQKLAPKERLALWASPYAPTQGDTLDVFVHSMGGAVSLRLYRLGWYNGAGARAVWQQDSVFASAQPACNYAPTQGVTCPWTRTARIPLDPRLAGGMYLIRAMDASGVASYYPLVLRSATTTDFAVVIPQLTWQAYNDYGGTSLYTADATTPSGLGNVVSFERPYSDVTGGSMVFSWTYSHEVRVARWLERNGYDISYVSGADLAQANAPMPTPRKGFIFAGHDEYWTSTEFDRVESARNHGTHLAFMSGNTAYWNVRLAPGTITGRAAHRVICFKSVSDPGAVSSAEVTTRFRDAPVRRPENALVGIMYMQGATQALVPLVAFDSAGGDEEHSIMAQAGLSAGDEIPRLVGSEGDQIVNNGATPARLQVLFKSPIEVTNRYAPVAPPYYYTTFYRAPSGAGVFAAGSNDFAREIDAYIGTSESPALQRFVSAIMTWMQNH